MITKEKGIVVVDLRYYLKSTEKCFRIKEIYNSMVFKIGDELTADNLHELSMMGFSYKIEENPGRGR